ncbi:MAG: heme ABC transporter ATP-binding protein [Oceanospirillales bacterium LUC14_002_19_P2]|nr:MAG: heme ABC transporter ATP-binding protein [Oceanospirillales bacterium LUC14_002_19_P2]
MICLNIDGVTVKRGSRDLLSDVSLNLSAGEVVAVLGPNGAGKSTLLRAITNEYPPESGRVLLGEKPVSDWRPLECALQMAILPQSSSLSFSFTVNEVVQMGRTPHASSREHNQDICRRALLEVDALHLANRSYTHLSGGEKQRVHLARVLAQIWEPPLVGSRVLLLDEPTSALDPRHQHQTLAVARAFASQGVGVIVILHDLNLAAQYADRIVILKNGKKCADGCPAEVLTHETIQSVFDIRAMIMAHPLLGYPLVVAE